MMRKPSGPDDLSMWDDPQESPAVRQLLRAGRLDQVDYDLDAGLARHLANLQSGAPLPAWAVAQSTVQKGWSLSLLAWLLPPMISAAVVGSWIYFRPAEPSPAQLAAASGAPLAAPSAAPALETRAASVAATQTPVVVASSAVAVAAPEPSLASHERLAGSVRSTRHAALTHRGRAHLERGEEPAPEGSSPARATPAIASSSPGSSNAIAASESKAAPAQAPHPAEPAQVQVQVQVKEAKEPAVSPAPTAPVAEQDKQAEPQAGGSGVSDARLEREMQMLAVAQRILSRDPERSLRLTRQGEHEFRGSMFSAERTQVSLLALVQLGRLDEARRLGAPFLRAYPNAPWSARLREALATGHLPPVH